MEGANRMNFYEDIYVLSHIKRYSTIFRIRDESVAEHSFNVAAICMKLWDDYDFDLGNALQMAIAHDMPEIELNDVPRVIKKKYPAISKVFKECEEEVLQELPRAARIACQWFNDNDSWEAQVVHLADAIQCKQYAEVEIKLGNTGYFDRVIRASIERIAIMSQDLEEIKRG